MNFLLSRTSSFSESSSSAAQDAKATAQAARTAVETLRFDVERLLMITQAFWIILKDRHGYSDEDLERMVMDIDLQDGKLDGKVASDAPAVCPHCGKVLSKQRPLCLYCGKAVPRDLFAR